MIRVVKDGEVIHEERVITGLVDKQTPIFSDEMETSYFHPRWNVPESIKVRELYPSLARGGTSFRRQGLKLSCNGRKVDPDERRLVVGRHPPLRRLSAAGPEQRAGRGQVRLPQQARASTCTTPTPRACSRRRAGRSATAACACAIRARLAEIVLGADKGWDAAKIAGDDRRRSPIENPITLDHKMPVHVTYFTAAIDGDGKETLFKDVYGHEKRVSQALAGKWTEIARGPDHLAPVTYGAARYAGGGNSLETFMNNLLGGF